MKKIAITLLVFLVAAGAVGATDSTRWLNVTVTEPGSNTKVEVHLPMELVVSVLGAVNVDGFRAGKVDLRLDEVDVDWPELFRAVTAAPDGKFVTVTSDDADVSLRKQAGTVYVDVEEKGGSRAKVKVTMPVAAMAALMVDGGSQVDVLALLESLRDLPDGELVRVDADDAQIRVWIE